MREKLGAVDVALVELLAERFRLVGQLWAHKAAVGMPLEDPLRESETVRRLRAEGARRGLPPQFVEELFRTVIAEGKRSAWPLTPRASGRPTRAALQKPSDPRAVPAGRPRRIPPLALALPPSRSLPSRRHPLVRGK